MVGDLPVLGNDLPAVCFNVLWIYLESLIVYLQWSVIFGERELALTFALCHRPSVCLSVCLSFVMFVCLTQAIGIFRNVFTPFGTLATH